MRPAWMGGYRLHGLELVMAALLKGKTSAC
jgi:hypothetical protein